MPEPLSPAEVQRRLGQQSNDIGALYELVQGVDEKVDTLTAEFRAHRDATAATLEQILQALRDR